METEDEQVEKLKKWWAENGRSVIAGVVIGVGGLFGYRYWIDVQESTAQQASSHFSQMVESLESSNSDNVMQQAEILIEDYSDTDYAIMARFALAKQFVESSEYDKAREQLEQVVGSAGDNPLSFLARKRLATVLYQMSRLDTALQTLSIDFPAEFGAGIEELKGDIYARQGKNDEAVSAYRRAQESTPGPSNVEFLRQKLEDLGSTG